MCSPSAYDMLMPGMKDVPSAQRYCACESESVDQRFRYHLPRTFHASISALFKRVLRHIHAASSKSFNRCPDLRQWWYTLTPPGAL